MNGYGIAKYNIQANGIGSGYFATDQTAPYQKDGHPFNEFIIKRTPARRWGNPDELQGAAIFQPQLQILSMVIFCMSMEVF
ncbi:MAG: hypothetical protein R2771_10430 [Saprospiraceae bacterium]